MSISNAIWNSGATSGSLTEAIDRLAGALSTSERLGRDGAIQKGKKVGIKIELPGGGKGEVRGEECADIQHEAVAGGARMSIQGTRWNASTSDSATLSLSLPAFVPEADERVRIKVQRSGAETPVTWFVRSMDGATLSSGSDLEWVGGVGQSLIVSYSTELSDNSSSGLILACYVPSGYAIEKMPDEQPLGYVYQIDENEDASLEWGYSVGFRTLSTSGMAILTTQFSIPFPSGIGREDRDYTRAYFFIKAIGITPLGELNLVDLTSGLPISVVAWPFGGVSGVEVGSNSFLYRSGSVIAGGVDLGYLNGLAPCRVTFRFSHLGAVSVLPLSLVVASYWVK